MNTHLLPHEFNKAKHTHTHRSAVSSCSPYLNTELKGQGQRCGGNAEQGNDGQKKEEIRRENIREVLPLCGPTWLLPFKLIISVYIGKKKKKKKKGYFAVGKSKKCKKKPCTLCWLLGRGSFHRRGQQKTSGAKQKVSEGQSGLIPLL